ncbi:acyl-CoA thioesterase [Leeia sp. TBRC 13508]|uniref:Acyl-CoA thioesterase n=1 Tax=Leeia speluncae TaxID=2884804 RepID=A0ABS8D844_9NEIS|nr:thioesterase family protein [Leeia speluncae]MCB6184379.1 acyl-CoA thioesterase [Leeia speluncae]
MAKITLPTISNCHFQTSLPVTVTHLNYGNHLGHDSLVSILHEARVQFLHQLGYTEMKMEDAGLILRDLAVQYLAEAFYGDILDISIEVAQLSGCGFELLYEVTHQSLGKKIARAQTSMVCFDYQTHKIMKLPKSFADRYQTPPAN